MYIRAISHPRPTTWPKIRITSLKITKIQIDKTTSRKALKTIGPTRLLPRNSPLRNKFNCLCLN